MTEQNQEPKKKEANDPHSPEAEQAILGGILFANRLSYAKDLKLKPEDFYSPQHRTIFEAMQRLDEAGSPIDMITLSNDLKNAGKSDAIGGVSYLAELLQQTNTAEYLPHYIGIIRKEAIKRQILDKAHRTKDTLNNADLNAVIDEMRAFYSHLDSISSLEEIAFFDYEKLLQEGKAYAQKGKSTGFIDLDRAVKIMPKELIIIGARVRHGKSSFAYNLLLNFLEQYPDESFIFFNFDVPSTIVMSRLATIWAKKKHKKSYAYKDVLPSFQTLKFHSEIIDAFGHFDKYGKDKRLAVVNTPTYTVEQIISHAERLSKEKPIGAIFIDYMELIKTQAKTDNEELRISHIVNQLRIASERLSCPIITLAQMNRSNAKEKKIEHRRPSLEGLRYSGRQEQEATTVLGLFNINAETLEIGQEAGNLSPSDPETVLEVITLKNRGGQSNEAIKLNFDMKSGCLENHQKPRL